MISAALAVPPLVSTTTGRFGHGCGFASRYVLDAVGARPRVSTTSCPGSRNSSLTATPWSSQRDEGEYAYAGQLILQGVPPYTLAYNMKFLGTYAAYAAIMSIFGQTITGIHLGLLVVNTATIILIFSLGRRLVNSVAGLAAGMSYAVLSVSPSVLGFAGHATHFVLLPVLGGTLLLPKTTDCRPFGLVFASGMLFGLGVLMKQPAVFFALFGAIYLASNDLHRRFRPERIFLRT